MSNDSKYGRLYPERAVSPLQETMKMLLEDGAVEGAVAQACAGALAKVDELSFPPDEPLFLLRGQDTLAPDTVRFYGDLVDARDADLDMDHIVAFADQMERWQPRKLPD